MKKLFTFIFAILFAMPCFATGVSGNSGTCDSGALGTDGGSTILRANYEPETIHLRWYDENNNLLTVNSASQSCTYGDSITIPTAPSKTGYRFTGWSVFSDYTPIEYLESTGTQRIDTGIYLNFKKDFRIVGNFINTDSTRKVLIGSLASYSPVYNLELHTCNSNEICWRHYMWINNTVLDNFSSFTLPYNTLIQYDVTYDANDHKISNILEYNGTTTSYDFYDDVNNYTNIPNNGETVNSLQLFLDLRSNPEQSIANGMSIGATKIYKDGVLVRDFIPVKDIHGVACMYDKVTGQFFYNAGTGNFVAGPEI